MSIKQAILGFLSWKSFTGYELKKLFAESDTLSWSGNSNQIYSTLVELHKEGLVSLEVQPQEDRPARKLYTITENGLAELKGWLVQTPQLPLQKNPFLLQLAWAGQLSPDELNRLLESYRERLKTELLMFEARDQRKAAPNRTPRENALWKLVSANGLAFYENELQWLDRVQTELAKIKE